MKAIPVVTTGMIVSFFSAICLADNPIIQTNYTADPAPMVYHDTVFLYTSHDEDTAQEFVMLDWLLYTSTDMVNWRDRGVVASLGDFSWAGTIHAWAPQCVHRNGKFYLYCPVFKKGIGVLVADSPYGPFSDPLDAPLFYHNTNDIDPTVFVDDDGQAYLYWGNPECYYVKLNEDMISLAGPIDSLSPKMSTYQEGPWLYKRDNRYYLAFASSCCPQGIGYALSDSPTGPWTEKGYIMNPSTYASHNHPGIIEYKGTSYVFGFDYELQFSRGISRDNELWRRSVCLSTMTYKTNGTINTVPWWGQGIPQPSVPQAGHLDPYDTIQAETICWSSGVRTRVCSDRGDGLSVDSIHHGDYIKVQGVDFGSDGAGRFMARVASAGNGGAAIEIHLDTLTGPLAGNCTVHETGSPQTWTTESCDISGAAGVHDVYFTFTGGDGLLFNFNWWKFMQTLETASAPGVHDVAEKVIRITACGATKTIHFDFRSSDMPKRVEIRLFDCTGRPAVKLFGGEITSKHLVLPLAGITPGTWFARITSNNPSFATVTRQILVP